MYMYSILKRIIQILYIGTLTQQSLNFVITMNTKIHRPIIQNLRIHETKHTEQKKLICISPGGFKGFYLMGIVSYIKEHYDLQNYIFSGASAGSWNALLFTYKGNLENLIHKIIENKPYLYKNESIRDFELLLKKRIISNCKSSDFDLSSVYIGVTTIDIGNRNKDTNDIIVTNKKCCLSTTIFTNFHDLDDVFDCCIASSHIPFVNGKFWNIYRNRYTFDGGLFRNPYYNILEPSLKITPSIWSEPSKKCINIVDYSTLLSPEKYNFYDLFQQGYNDTKQNSDKLDKIFVRKK